jgi:3-oxoacyl-[acyl-carrier protein] reductase
VDLELEGRRVLITGASRNLGAAIAAGLAEEGCALALCARSVDELERTAEGLRERGAEVFARVADVADPEALRGFVDASAEELGGLDVVVSNASAGSVKGDDAWRVSFAADLNAFVVLAGAALPHLEAAEEGTLIAISSTNAVSTTLPASPNSFSAMKAAIIHHATALATAWAPRGIRVNTLSPGPVDFPGGNWEKVKQARPEVYEKVLGQIPLGRYGTAREVADAVAFLASPRSGFFVGANLVMDGGMLGRVHYFRTPNVLGPVAEVLGSRFLGHPPSTRYRVEITAPEHPLVAGIGPFEVSDEQYVCEPHGELEVLAHTEEFREILRRAVRWAVD